MFAGVAEDRKYIDRIRGEGVEGQKQKGFQTLGGKHEKGFRLRAQGQRWRLGTLVIKVSRQGAWTCPLREAIPSSLPQFSGRSWTD